MSKEKRALTLFGMLFGALLQYPSVFFKDIASIFRDEKEISIPNVPEKLDLSSNKMWIKAELHQHHLYEISLPELLNLYKDEGYSFIMIALKDNERRFFPEEYSTDELLVVEGVEQAFKSADKKFLHAHQRLFIDGYGHVVIQAERLTLSSIRSALLSGAFYASEHHHKARVKRYMPDISSGEVYLEIESDKENKIRFIGKDSNLLKEVKGDEAIYKIKGDEIYIRAEVVDSEGKRLFLQPVFLSGIKENPYV
ncbi:MAG: hypothetical protein COS84_02450 [Armatimonadetes bacterium CG07_land_8_20_14_0_80_40_9]|nr:MAG: hypothetical protein COS84_02450 [Armatimonadetes bacterium CG07_land_8_20_14_0_80_40_9]